MKHVIAFLPLIGFVISGLSYLVIWFAEMHSVPGVVAGFVLSVIPLLVTGGFHMDGYIDVQDARSSFQGRGKKLEILEDPHIGAFAVIRVLTYAIIWGAAMSVLVKYCLDGGISSDYLYIFIGAYPLVRGLCGVSSLEMEKANKGGMLDHETQGSNTFDIVFLMLQALVAAVFMIMVDMAAGLMSIFGILCFYIFYHNMCKREFGGVTGDTAGYFVVAGEEVILVVLAVWVLAQGVVFSL